MRKNMRKAIFEQFFENPLFVPQIHKNSGNAIFDNVHEESLCDWEIRKNEKAIFYISYENSLFGPKLNWLRILSISDVTEYIT